MIHAAEDYGEIKKRMVEIADEEKPRCPISGHKPLHVCLRESTRCPQTCRYYHDWIGPE